MNTRKFITWCYRQSPRFSVLDQLVFLKLLGGDGLSPACLAEEIKGDARKCSAIDAAIRRLEALGLVKMKEGDHSPDRRNVFVTDKGRDMVRGLR